MLKKGFRLRKKEDFDRVFRSGKPLFFKEISCRYCASTVPIRVGFSLSKKHLPLATDRNRLRRVLSEAFFEQRKEWPEQGDFVFFTVRKPKKIDLETSRHFMREVLKSIKKG